jgi:hypothetical protein
MNASGQIQIAVPVTCTNEQLAFFAERQKQFRERSITFDPHDHTQERRPGLEDFFPNQT